MILIIVSTPNNDYIIGGFILALYFYSACPPDVPLLVNGVLASGGCSSDVFGGHVLTYMCATNFDSTDDLICICDTTTDPDSSVWDCGDVNFTTTCRRSKQLDTPLSTLFAKYAIIIIIEIREYQYFKKYIKHKNHDNNNDNKIHFNYVCRQFTVTLL